MIQLQTYYPIIIPTSNEPMTKGDLNFFVGFWIVINAIWLICAIIHFSRLGLHKLFPKKIGYYNGGLLEDFSLIMLAIWFIIGCFYTGYWVAEKFLN